MNLIDERLAWLAAGVVIGWFLHWCWSRRSRASATTARRSEPASSASQPSHAEQPATPSYHEQPASSRLIDVGAARAAGFNIKHADDLTIIEGIGPRTDELLRANQVGSFAQLAQLDTVDILEILERGGPSFRLTDPSTWTEQASLATENRWPELKRLQKEMLDGAPSADET